MDKPCKALSFLLNQEIVTKGRMAFHFTSFAHFLETKCDCIQPFLQSRIQTVTIPAYFLSIDARLC